MKAKLCCLIVSIVLFGATALGAANANTFNVDGIFGNGAFLTGTIGVDSGVLLSVDLHANGSLPGDTATFWPGPVVCEAFNCLPDRSSYGYFYSPLRLSVTETYVASSKTYDFFFNGGGSLAYLDLMFTLQPSGMILGGMVFDPACGGPGCPPAVNLIGGTVTPTPLPSAQILFLAGLGILGLLGWHRKRKGVVAT
jgi:hypothetical protein